MRLLAILAILLLAGCLGTPQPALEPTGVTNVPTLPSPIRLERTIDPEAWSGAHVVESSFVIDDGSMVAGEYPFVLRLASDSERLFVGIQISNVTERFERVEGGLSSPAENIEILLSADDDELRAPADRLVMNHYHRNGTSTTDGYWNGETWAFQQTKVEGRFNDGLPSAGRWGRGGENKTLDAAFVIYRSSSFPEFDGFQAKGPTAFRLAVRLVLPLTETARIGEPYDAHSSTIGVDGREASERDPAGWMRLYLTS